jgi:RNA polymerase sigma-70 factor (ECF subfamily)
MSPAAAGDAEAEHAFEQLFRASYSMLVGQVFLLTTNRAEAEEAVQEAFARLWTRWCDLRGCENPEAWLRRVAVNFAISRWRKHSRQVSLRESHAPPVQLDSSMLELANALRGVSVKHRQALLLHYVVGLTIAEIAVEMSSREGTVKSWLSRGRGQLDLLLRDREAASNV